MKSTILRRFGAALLALATAMGLSSCFQVQSQLNVKADGSGTIENKMLMGAQLKAMMEQNPEGENPFSKEELEKQGEQLGAKLKSVEEINEGGFAGVKAIYEFEDINKVKFTQEAPTGDEGEEKGEPVTFAFTPGSPAKLVVKLPQDKEPAAGEEKEEAEKDPNAPDMSDPQMAAMMKGMFAGAKMAIILNIDGEIVKTNASHVDGSKITLLEMDMEAMMGDPKGMEKMESMKGSSPFGGGLKDVKGVKVESTPELEVEFK